MMRSILFSIVFTCTLMPAYALELSGVYEQGGFLIGQAKPGSSITINGDETKVDASGNFVFGLNRNFPELGEVVEKDADGQETKQVVFVKQREYQTQSIKGIAKKHVNPNPEHMKRIKADSAQIYKARAVFESLPFIKTQFVLPASGTITGVYGSRRLYNGEERNWHKGLDIANKTGTPIYAPAAGVVRLALANSFFNGNLVILDHGHQMMTIYAHMDSMSVKAGDTVMQGDKLGEIGTTGRSTGPHLHWGLYWRNIALDPRLLLNNEDIAHD